MTAIKSAYILLPRGCHPSKSPATLLPPHEYFSRSAPAWKFPFICKSTQILRWAPLWLISVWTLINDKFCNYSRISWVTKTQKTTLLNPISLSSGLKVRKSPTNHRKETGWREDLREGWTELWGIGVMSGWHKDKTWKRPCNVLNQCFNWFVYQGRSPKSSP